MSILWLLAVPLALACERGLDPDARRRARARLRLRRIRRLPPPRETLTPQMREHWQRVMTKALTIHRYWLGLMRDDLANDAWEVVERARRELAD